jgi:origin recognition complex subunit 1
LLKDKILILLIDELDALVTMSQAILYNLFEWPSNKDSRLMIVTIANTINLPDKLKPKIASRIGNRRLIYEPYTA